MNGKYKMLYEGVYFYLKIKFFFSISPILQAPPSSYPPPSPTTHLLPPSTPPQALLSFHIYIFMITDNLMCIFNQSQKSKLIKLR